MERSTKQRGMLVVTAVAAVAAASVMVVQMSSAAFTDSVSSADNSWQTGSVTLTQNGDGSAMFSVTDMVPDDSEERCIAVTYEGSVDADVRLYSDWGPTGSTDLAGDLDLLVEHGTGAGGFPDCNGFTSAGTVYDGDLSDFATIDGFVGGQDDWGPAGGSVEERAYRFTVTLDSASTQEDQSVSEYEFVWEARNQ